MAMECPKFFHILIFNLLELNLKGIRNYTDALLYKLHHKK